MRRGLACAVAMLAAGCIKAPAPQTQPTPEQLRGVASWYGQEFAGRTTANGEIFDPWGMTAAHRTLPFGTVVDVTNARNGQSVRVRINDRGPYINDRIIDVSYAAAAKIGLVEPGIGEVQLAIVKIGRGDREPPAPYIVSVPEIKAIDVPPAKSVEEVPVVVDEPKVEQQPAVEVRRQVSTDGKRIETFPVGGVETKAAAPPSRTKAKPVLPPPAPSAKFVVQVGAFALENNAKLLKDQLATLGATAYIDHTQLFRVRIGPFATRDEAIRMRTRLETAGLSAMVVAQ